MCDIGSNKTKQQHKKSEYLFSRCATEMTICGQINMYNETMKRYRPAVANVIYKGIDLCICNVHEVFSLVDLMYTHTQ